jgi:hypothetical protein
MVMPFEKLLGANVLIPVRNIGEVTGTICGCPKSVEARDIEDGINNTEFRVRLATGFVLDVFGSYFMRIDSDWYIEQFRLSYSC